MPVYNAKSIPAEVHSSTKDPEVAAFLKTGPVLGAHKPIHEQRVEHNAFIDKVKPPIGKIEHFPNPDYAALWVSRPKGPASCAMPSARRSRPTARPLSTAWL